MLPIDLNSLIQAITGVASPIIKDKLQRNETVIKILQKFNLAPEHPPSDFSGIYAYALVEYGIGKPKLFLELFRDEEIKQAFRKAFDNGNPSIILSQIKNYIDTHALSGNIRNLGVDARIEMAKFYLVFCEVAKTSRTPSDILLSQQITTLQQQSERFATVEGICIEIAQILSQNNLALPTSKETVPSNQCKATALAVELRGWLETLSYRFEKYEFWCQDYFEWIINIPIRRNRYDRVLIRGIAGEAQVSDVLAMRSSVERERADEGWLVTARRISRAARAEVEKDENTHLGCYTFDELLAQDADFSGYLEWLEAEIKRRQIDTKYVPLACSKEEIDSVTGRQIAVSRYEEEDGWIDGYIDRWLDDPVKEHISILGEFGTGKTWFAFHYAWVALQRYKDAQKRGVELPRLPLVIPLRDYAKAVSVESLFSEFFFRKHEIPLPGYSAFEQLNRMGKLLLIFDGFDEMAARVDRQEMINNFWELAKVVVPGAKVILTCRSEHFPEAKEGRALLNAELQASTANLTGETPQFEVLELEKFNDEQIKQVLSYQATDTTVEHVMSNPQLLDLARRPVMTDLILEALPDIEAGKPVDMSRVYLYAVRHKMETDIKTERTFTNLADKLYFLCELSWEMLSTDQMSLNYRVFPDRIRRLFGTTVQEEKDLDHWHFDMMGQTMLIRNADGDYTPAHRSLLEFFVAYKFAAEIGALASDFTNLARGQAQLNNSTPQNYTWSEYFQKNVDVTSALLENFVCESLEKLRLSFGLKPLTKAVIDLIKPMINVEAFESIIGVIEATHGKRESEVRYVGGNAATLIVNIDKTALKGKNLSHTVIAAADFSDTVLHRTNFTEVTFKDCIFTQTFGRINSVAFSRNNKLLAALDDKGQIRVWRFTDNKEIFNIKGHNPWASSVAFHPDCITFATAGKDKIIYLWDAETSQVRKTLQGHTGAVRSLAFSSDGYILASGSSDKTARLWDVETGKCLQIFTEHSDRIMSVAFSDDGCILTTGSCDKTARLWDVSTGKCINILNGHTDAIRTVAFSRNGDIIASGSADGTVRLWSVKTGKCLRILHEHIDKVSFVAFSHDGQQLASASYDKVIKLWNISTGRCVTNLKEHTSPVRSIAFSYDNQILASGSEDKTVKLWNLKNGNCLKTLQGYTYSVWPVTFSPDGQKLASGSEDKTIRLWDVVTGKCLQTFLGHTNRIWSVAFSPDGQKLASASKDKTIRIWDIITGICLKVLKGHTSDVRSICFCDDGRILASGSFDNTLKLWDTSNGNCIRTLTEHTDIVQSLASIPNGTIVASGSMDSTFRLWNINDGECIKTVKAHEDKIYSIALSLDGKMLATSSSDYTVKLWDFYTGEHIKTFEGHTDTVEFITFSHDCQTLVSGSYDQTIKIWDVNTGKSVKTLQEHSSTLR